MTGPTVRVAAFGWSLLASATFGVPLTAAFTHPDISWTLRAAIVLLAVSSGARPVLGLGALALLLPLSTPLHALLPRMPASAELTSLFVLAFLCGASWRLAPPRRGAPERIAGPALVLAAAVVSSTIVEFRALQAVVPRQPLALDLWRYVTGAYWIEPGGFPLVHEAVRWIAGLTLAVYAERALRGSPSEGPRMFRAWMLGGATGAMFAAVRLGEILVRSESSAAATLVWVVQEVRMSVLHADLNAAGSYFSIFLVAGTVVWFRRRLGWLIVTLPVLLLAFSLARSRAAMGSVVVVLTAWSASIMGRSTRIRVALGVVALGGCLLAGILAFTSQSNVDLDQALTVRVQMTEVGLRTASRNPLFGVGLGDYIRMSRRWIGPEMTLLRGFAPEGENAHNNFLQILVELGLPACLFFIYLAGSVARLGWTRRAEESPAEAVGVALGLSAFLASAFFGHPLLIPQVAAAFFLALGLAAGLAQAPLSIARWPTSLFRGAAAFYLLSLLWRLA